MDQRRKYERFNFLASALVISDFGKSRFQAYVTSLGRGGLGLFTEGFVEVGKQVELELTWRDKNHRTCTDKVKGTIVTSQVGIDGNTLGVQFMELLGVKNRKLLDYMKKAQQTGSWGV